MGAVHDGGYTGVSYAHAQVTYTHTPSTTDDTSRVLITHPSSHSPPLPSVSSSTPSISHNSFTHTHHTFLVPLPPLSPSPVSSSTPIKSTSHSLTTRPASCSPSGFLCLVSATHPRSSWPSSRRPIPTATVNHPRYPSPNGPRSTKHRVNSPSRVCLGELD